MSSRTDCPDFVAILRDAAPDATIFELVAECFQDELGRLAARRCRDDALAQDAAQDALLTAIESLDTFRGEAPLDHWLKRLVVSSCARLRRGRKNAPAYNVPLDDMPPEKRPGEPVEASQEAAVLLSERLRLLERALAELPDDNRELILLHEGEELPLAELAARYALTVDGVKARLKRARAQLRQRLVELAEGE
jgi:RNA polymerase sigma-70 factor (ECF subfamily)